MESFKKYMMEKVVILTPIAPFNIKADTPPPHKLFFTVCHKNDLYSQNLNYVVFLHRMRLKLV